MKVGNSALLKSFASKLPSASKNYVKNLFPIFQWLPFYNLNWFSGDLIAGITVGLLLVPQALAYAELAGVPLEFGLYTSLMGVMTYCIFATTKDVTIGPTAVLSQLCGQILISHNSKLNMDPVVFLLSVAFVSGVIELLVGLLHLGIIVDFIPTPVIVGFTSGAAVSIICGQLPGLLGIKGINKNDPAYLVTFNTLKNIGKSKLDCVIGVSALFLLVGFRLVTRQFLKKGVRWFSWVGQSSNAISTIIFTLVSYLLNSSKEKPLFKIVGDVPRGLNYFEIPSVSHLPNIISASFAIVIVSILEHLAIAKSFGRLNGYTADPNQELVALGFSNILGSFIGGFPSCGSFSRSSVKSRSGVRTPLAGIITGALLVLALYVITPAFYYIPNAVLSAMIINAITDLLTRPSVLKEFYEIEILDLMAFIVAFLIVIFVSIEISIFCSVAFALLVLMYRIARPKVQVLLRDIDGGWAGSDEITQANDKAHYKPSPAGIAVFRIEESLSYPNSSHVSGIIRKWVEQNTKFGGKSQEEDQLWCNTKKSGALNIDLSWEFSVEPPLLKAIVFDFSAVNGIDSTGLQSLVDLRREVERYAGRQVLFYFAHVHSRFQPILHYFLINLIPNYDIAPVITVVEGVDLLQQQTIKNIEEDRIQRYGCDTEYSSLFIHRTIDQAIEDALIRVENMSLSSQSTK